MSEDRKKPIKRNDMSDMVHRIKKADKAFKPSEVAKLDSCPGKYRKD